MAAGVTANSTTVFIEDDTHANAGGDGDYDPADIASVGTTQLGGAGTYTVTAGSPTITRAGGTAMAASDVNRLIWGPGITRNSRITAVADPNATITPNAEATLAGVILTASHFAQIDGSSSIPVYRSAKSLQNGDGAGTAATTFAASNVRIIFDTGRTYLVSTVGSSNRFTRFGSKVQGASGKPSGRDGVVLDMGAAMTMRGNMLLYGSIIRTSAGGLNFQPGAAGLQTEIINCLIQSAGNVSFGLTSSPLDELYNVDIILGTGIASVVTNMNAMRIERVTIALNGGNAFIQTSAAFAGREIVFCGTPVDCDIRFSGGADMNVIDCRWSGNAPKCTLANARVQEWVSFSSLSYDPTNGLVIPGVPLRLLNGSGATLWDAVTDATGNVFVNKDPDGLGREIFDNTIMVNYFQGSPASTFEQGPFTLLVNQTGSPVPGYLPYSKTFPAPYVDLPGGFGKQYLPMMLDVPMVPTGGGGGGGQEEWRAAYG